MEAEFEAPMAGVRVTQMTAKAQARDKTEDLMASKNPTKTKLLERAIEAIDAGGEASVRTQKIVADCGVTAPILYRFFENREGLIIAAQAERYRRTLSQGSVDVANEVSRRMSRCLSKQDVVDTMKWLFEVTMSPDRHRQRLIRLEVIGSAVSRPALMREVAQTEQEIIERFTKVFEVAVEHGWVNSSIDLRAMIALWFGVIMGRYMPEISDGYVDGDEWNKATAECFLHLMFGEYKDF